MAAGLLAWRRCCSCVVSRAVLAVGYTVGAARCRLLMRAEAVAMLRGKFYVRAPPFRAPLSLSAAVVDVSNWAGFVFASSRRALEVARGEPSVPGAVVFSCYGDDGVQGC